MEPCDGLAPGWVSLARGQGLACDRGREPRQRLNMGKEVSNLTRPWLTLGGDLAENAARRSMRRLTARALCAPLRRTMKTATVRELRNRYAQLLKWLEAGEEIMITRRGVPIARLVPERPQTKQMLDWTDSAAFGLEQLKLRPLTARESAELLDYNRGPD